MILDLEDTKERMTSNPERGMRGCYLQTIQEIRVPEGDYQFPMRKNNITTPNVS